MQSRSVDMYVSRLRASLKAAGVGWTVQSVYATGYRLILKPDTDQSGAGASGAGASPEGAA